MNTGQKDPDKEKIFVDVDKDLEDLIAEFIQIRYQDTKTIISAVKKEDIAIILTLGHSMKGSGGSYGFDGISTIGGRIEQAAKQKDFNRIKEQASALVSYLDRLEINYI